MLQLPGRTPGPRRADKSSPQGPLWPGRTLGPRIPALVDTSQKSPCPRVGSACDWDEVPGQETGGRVSAGLKDSSSTWQRGLGKCG